MLDIGNSIEDVKTNEILFQKIDRVIAHYLTQISFIRERYNPELETPLVDKLFLVAKIRIYLHITITSNHIPFSQGINNIVSSFLFKK